MSGYCVGRHRLGCDNRGGPTTTTNVPSQHYKSITVSPYYTNHLANGSPIHNNDRQQYLQGPPPAVEVAAATACRAVRGLPLLLRPWSAVCLSIWGRLVAFKYNHNPISTLFQLFSNLPIIVSCVAVIVHYAVGRSRTVSICNVANHWLIFTPILTVFCTVYMLIMYYSPSGNINITEVRTSFNILSFCKDSMCSEM